MEQARTAARTLEAWGSERNWCGPDPYDALNLRRFASLARGRLGRRILTQAVKRSPVDLRRPLGIPPAQTPAALAHVVSAYARNGFLPQELARERLRALVARLETLRSPGFEEPCWGYHFDVQTRVFFYPKHSPNTIATSFAGSALLDAWLATRDSAYLTRAEAVGDFFLRHVPQTPVGEGAYFGYLVADRTPIHNANLLVCALLARLGAETGRTDFARAADAGVRYALEHQRPDGSWPYGEEPGLGWVDGFHTGYVLESLRRCRLSGIAVPESALTRGIDYYEQALFLADGTPRYSSTSTYPADIQCAAQGIQTFALENRVDVATRVFAWARARMLRRDGAFAFQRRRLYRNTTPHIRWAEAPMLHALAHLIEALERS